MANYDLTYEGSRVQGILDTGNSLKDAGYIFRGEATPSTVPGTPTERVAYIGGPGTYTNFGSSITVPVGRICVFKYTGSAWSNQVIDTKVSDGAAYKGIATPTTNPGSPIGSEFYLAVQAGTYTNFGSLTVTAGINILKYNGSTWSVQQAIAIDAEPTQGSDHLVKSGGVLGSIIQNGPAFDLSAYNAQGGVLATYADLSAALTALNALPADYKKGGMSFKFVLSSDNKYVQYRLMSDTFNTTPANWQGVDDEPTAGSENILKSGGVSSHLYNGFINGKGSNQFSNYWIKLLKNRHYKLIFDNPLWEHTSASETLFVVTAINGSTATNIFAVGVTEKISRVYEFVTPSEFDSIRIALKADAGVRVNFVIEDAEPYLTIGGVTIFNSNNLTYGAWYNSSGNAYSRDNFDVRSIGFVNVKENTIYKVQNLPSGYKLSVICYTSDGTYISNGSFWFSEVSSFTTPANCGMIHIQFRKTDLTAIDLTSFPNVIVSEYSDYFVPVFSRDLSGALSRFTTLKKGQYNEAVNDYPSFQSSTNRATTELIPLGRGRVQISIGEGYDFYFKPYDSYSVIGDKGGPWTSETTVYDLVHSFWVVLVRHHDNSALSDSDIANCGLTITALTPLYQTVATTLGDMSIERKVAALSKNELAITRPKIETWSHYFIRKLTNNNRIVVPSQSLADIHISKMLGAKFMEFNLMFTSDNVPICRHGVTNTKLSGLIDGNGDDVEIDDIREVSLAQLKANYRYKSLYPQFQTTVTTLEEALQVCNELDIIPIVSYDSRAVSLMEKYCGNRWCAYIGSTGIPQRPSGLNKNIPCMVSMWANNPNESVENYLAMADAFGYGSVFAMYLPFLRSLSDSSAAAFIQAMKEKGTNICIDEYTDTLASDYADIVKYQKMGAHIYHEYSVINQDIFDTTKIADDKNNFADVDGTFSQGDGCIELSNGNEISLSINGSSIVSAIKAVIQYSGTIKVSLGEYINNVEKTSSDNEIIEISTVLEDLNEELTISSVGESKIFSISLYTKNII